MNGIYDIWREASNGAASSGLWYAADVAGSDIMRHPEAYSNQPGRHVPESFYSNGEACGTYGLLSYLKENDIYTKLYSVIARSNVIINEMESRENFKELISQSEPTEVSQTYGEAVAMRATAYRELIKNWGDVPYASIAGKAAVGLANRDSIYDVLIGQLQRVAPIMYRIGDFKQYTGKEYMSRTYVEGLIGRMALDAAGYQVRRGDINRIDSVGHAYTYEKLGTENNGATYARRTDYKNLYAIAQKAFKAVIDNSGSAVWHDSDPRVKDEEGRSYGNPFQYFFQQMHNGDGYYADESIYEIPMSQGNGNSSRPYEIGRPSNGGSKDAYPCKDYGQARVNPAFYYGMMDPKDMRRDVDFTVTGSDGKGNEMLIPFVPNSKSNGGGISTNKWDENRQDKPWVKAQRISGINTPYMRLSEIYLGYAEACAVLGNDAEAKTYLSKIRNRAFHSAADADIDGFIAKEGSLFKAIIDERGFEFGGEGDRRWTLIRTGLIPEKIKAIKELTQKMIAGLKANGYYTFDNGNTISCYVWTKMVDAKKDKGYRLTAQCPVGQEDDPVLYPSWRGQKDNWEDFGAKNLSKTNVAIKGLFSYIDPNGAEAKALESEGYKKTNWAQDILKNEDEYDKYLFYNYDYVKAPIYLWPFTPNTLSIGGFKNGYGFANE